LMPYTFEGLKKQRFRWCFGGIQILKKHWNALMPWAHWLDPQNRLTGVQRYFYLVGGLQWFTDVLNLVFGLFLTLGAISSILYERFSIRPLTGPLLIMPAVFLFLHLWRFLWVLRQSLHLRARTALRSMYNFFSLGWAVTLACFQGLIQKKGVFLRTPKSRDDSKVLGALRVTQWEGLIGLTFMGFGLAAVIAHPQFKSLWLGFLLAWQGSLFLAAPYFSLLSIRSAQPAPTMRQPVLDRGRPVTESPAAKWAWASALVLAALVWIAFKIPLPNNRPSYSQYQPPDIPPQVLIGADTPIPTVTPTSLLPPPPILSTPTPIPTLILTSTNPATATLPTTFTPSVTATVTPSLTPTATSGFTPIPISPTATSTLTSTSTYTPTPITPVPLTSGP